MYYSVDIIASRIISVIKRILVITSGIIYLIACRYVVALIGQYTIADICYKTLLLSSISKFFKNTF